MKCPKCGAELSEDTRFCSFCGEKIEDSTTYFEEKANESGSKYETESVIKQDIPKFSSSKSANKGMSIADKIKDKCTQYWNKLSVFGKISTIAIIVFTFLCLIAFMAGKPLAGFIAVVQIALMVVAILIKKQIIKVPKNWLYIVLIAFAFLLLVPYFSLFGAKKIDAKKYAWSEIIMSDIVPEPKSHLGKIIGNSEDYLSLYVYKTSETNYKDYIEACKNKGFTVDAEQIDSMFDAYNENGYKLSLSYYANDKRMGIYVDGPVYLGTLAWPEAGLSQMIPAPQSNTGKVDKNEESGFYVTVGDMPLSVFKDYTKSCSDMGFIVDLVETEKGFFAKNADGYKLDVKYQGNNTISIAIDEPEYNVDIEVKCEKNWIFSKYDVKVYIDDLEEDTLSHGTTKTYTKVLKRGEHEIKFVSDEDDSVTGNVVANITQDEPYKFEISCSSNGIRVTTVAGTVVGETNGSVAEPESENTTSEAENIETETQEPTDDLMASLEVNIAKEMAERAVIVAMTNGQATDVFAFDGNSYDKSKFHSYSDIDDFFMSVDTEGTWTAEDDKTWHVDGMVLKIQGYDTYLKVSCDITKNEENYVVSNVDKKIASKNYLDSNDASKINEEHIEPSESNPFLTVSPELVKDDRDTNAESTKVNAETKRQEWIENQFSWWDHSHTELQKLVKRSLNDEKSYKFIDSSFIDVSDEERQGIVNNLLKSMGVIEQVEVGDLLVIMDFSAKNAFNATIKSQAYGIVRFSDNSTTLVYIQ